MSSLFPIRYLRSRLRRAETVALALIVCSSGTAAAFAASTPSAAIARMAPTSSSAVVQPSTTPYRPLDGFFGTGSEWTRDVGTAPLNPDSANLVANLASQVSTRYGGVAAFNYYNYNVSFYAAQTGTPRRDVIFDDCQRKGYVPASLYTVEGGAHFASVPIPPEAVPAAGSDGELSVWDPATDQLWEFWKAKKQADGWHACWGGRIDSFSTNPGYFAKWMGVAASGLSVSAGSVGIKEMEAGSINHAMSLNVVEAANASQFSYPANRSDGRAPVGTPHAILQGQRFRLDPSLDVRTLKLTPIATAVAIAAQKYGFIVNDTGDAVAVIAESGTGAKNATGVDPWTALRAGAPGYNIMKGFPWASLQALPVDYGKPAAPQ